MTINIKTEQSKPQLQKCRTLCRWTTGTLVGVTGGLKLFPTNKDLRRTRQPPVCSLALSAAQRTRCGTAGPCLSRVGWGSREQGLKAGVYTDSDFEGHREGVRPRAAFPLIHGLTPAGVGLPLRPVCALFPSELKCERGWVCRPCRE